MTYQEEDEFEESQETATERKFLANLNKYSPHVKFADCSHEESTIPKWGFHFESEEYADAVEDGAYWSDGSYSLEGAIAEYLTFSFKQLVKKSQRIRELEAELAVRKLFDKTEEP
jgi:hypothetical protein